MSIFYRIVVVLLVIAAGYSLFGVVNFKWMYHNVNNPKAEFLISGNENSEISVVEFVSYNCGYCKQIHKAIEDAKAIRKDIRFVIRPIMLGDENTQKLATIAMAAGLQGKFDEMSNAFMEYPEANVPEEFIKETAELYGIDYEQMVKDSDSKKVQKLLDNNLFAVNHANIDSVPGFVIGKKIYIVTDDTVPDLKQILDMIVAAEK